MSYLLFCLAVVFALMAIYQGAFVVWFCVLLFKRPVSHTSHHDWPQVAIMMSLRGADSQLQTSLQRILNQDYPHYRLHVIVDSHEDPAYAVVNQVAASFNDRVDLSVLTERRTTCGLQCSAFVQAYQRIDQDAEVIVTVDGDLMPHPTWLKELLMPMHDPRVGATFGNRWFSPSVTTYGGLVRYLWNVAAVVPMALLSIPWGGCMAIRRSAFDEVGMVDKWSQAIVHDAPIVASLKELSLKIRFVPNLMMPIREQCSWRFCMDFIKRQLTWTRIYHAGWFVILLHAWVTTLLWIFGFGLVLGCISTGDWSNALYAGGCLLGYVLFMLILVVAIEAMVRFTLRRRHEPTAWSTWATWFKMPIALVMAQGTHFLATLIANRLRQVTWRGVTYKLNGPWDVKLQLDLPFEPADDGASL